uniref:NEDD4-binding protein 1 n=1 Tax=Pyxicephalus adspersus TaxID=30357 RepID=A0AAV3AX93_PYXAD|nr:TPA: hypothetical protein GDO54_010960 [Pyxicephalus adspersus]
MDGQDKKLVLFQKLGYAEEDIKKALLKLGKMALDNDVLEELIYTGNKAQSERDAASSKSVIPRLVARGCSSMEDMGNNTNADNNHSLSNLRAIVIDGSNVAMSHGCRAVFSCRGIEIAVDWFRKRGHDYIKVFVPSWRKEKARIDSPISDKHILDDLEKKMFLVYTPSRKINGKRIVCYDDRYIVKLAYEKDAIIVSNDNYHDLQSENVDWKRFIEKRLLMYSFVNNKFMPPDDPLGRHGTTLSNFLRKTHASFDAERQLCPYGQKCTYGIKCKFSHPERLNQQQLSVADELRAKTKQVFKDYKCPEQFESTKETSTSLKMKQILHLPQERQMGNSGMGKWACSSINQGFTVNTSPDQQNQPPHRELRIIDPILSSTHSNGEKMQYKGTDQNHCCRCNYMNSGYSLSPHTHSMDCSCIQKPYLPYTFLSETLPHNNYTQSGYCKHQGSGQLLCLHEHSRHVKNIDMHAQRMDTLVYLKNVKDIYEDPNYYLTQHPSVIKPSWSYGHFTTDACPFLFPNDNCRLLSDTQMFNRKEVYTLLCGLYTNAEIDQAMAANPETTNILELADIIQKNRRS